MLHCPYFYNICPCANGIVYDGLEVVRTFLCLCEQSESFCALTIVANGPGIFSPQRIG